MQKEQKLIQEEAQEAVLQAAASQPAAMAGAHVEPPAAAAAAAAAGGAGALDLNAVQAKVRVPLAGLTRSNKREDYPHMAC
jgi:putative N-acetylmannosamine-6-phosphate epimerase